MAFKHGPLPDFVRSRLMTGPNFTFEERNQLFDKFVERYLKIVAEDPEEFKKSAFIFSKTSEKKKKGKLNRGRTRKKLTFRDKRDLGLHALGRKSLKYSDLLPLHYLWTDYMTKCLKLDDLKKQQWQNSPENPNFESVHQKLHRADYHGCKMSVVRSKCHSHVGKSGIVVMETKNCFRMLGEDDIVRTIPKNISEFTFDIDEFKFKFFGKNFQGRPAERSSKKIKTIYAMDL